MTTLMMNTAESALRRQVEILGGEWISLDDLWRSAGCPEGREPDAWAELASALLVGFTRYRQGLARAAGRPTPVECPPLWRWDGEDAAPWRSGDLMADDLIARAYASYLDSDDTEWA